MLIPVLDSTSLKAIIYSLKLKLPYPTTISCEELIYDWSNTLTMLAIKRDNTEIITKSEVNAPKFV
jgi:hypothetical protein